MKRQGFVLSLCVSSLILSGCANNTADETGGQFTSQEIQSRYERLIGDNDLLISPDFWGSLTISYEGEIAYRLINGQTLKETWPHSPEETFNFFADKTDKLGAAYTIVEFDLFSSYDFLRDLFPELEQQWIDVDANNDEAIFTLHALNEIAKAVGLPLQPHDIHRSIVKKALGSDYSAERNWAQELAREWNMDATAAFDAKDYLVLEEIPYSLLSGYRLGVPYSDVDKDMIDSLVAARLRDDTALARLYTVLMSYGDNERAEKLKNSFNGNRVLSDEAIIEMPVFNGTLDSTFRVARYIHETGKVKLDSRVHKTVVSKLEKYLDSSSYSDAVLAASALQYLEPAKLDDVNVEVLFRNFLQEAELDNLTDGHLFSADELVVWEKIFPYAQALGVSLDFPGLSEEGRKTLLAYDSQEMVLVACDLVIDLHTLGTLDTYFEEQEIAESIIASYLEPYQPGDLATSVISQIQRAYLYLNRPLPLSIEEFNGIIKERSVKCVGGYKNFLQELPGDSPCTADGSFYVYRFNEEGKGNK